MREREEGTKKNYFNCKQRLHRTRKRNAMDNKCKEIETQRGEAKLSFGQFTSTLSEKEKEKNCWKVYFCTIYSLFLSFYIHSIYRQELSSTNHSLFPSRRRNVWQTLTVLLESPSLNSVNLQPVAFFLPPLCLVDFKKIPFSTWGVPSM